MVKIKIKVKDGRLYFDVEGAKGPVCEDIGKVLEQMGTVEKKEYKPDYYDFQTISQKEKQ